MKEDPEGWDHRIGEQAREKVEEILSAKGQKRWDLLVEFFLEHGYTREDGYSCRHGNNYLMRIAEAIIYIEDVEPQAYEEIRGLLERRVKIQTNPSIIANALTIGGSTMGGAFLGFVLIRAGLHPLVMIPSIIIPPVVSIYGMLKQSAKESDNLARIDASLREYQEHMYYEDEAVRRLYYRTYRDASADR